MDIATQPDQTKGKTMTTVHLSAQQPKTIASAEGTARLVAEIFDHVAPDGTVTYIASLSFETEYSVGSIHRYSCLDLEEAVYQIKVWANRHNLELGAN